MSAPFRLDRVVVRVSGADAAPFLSNLLTQDVAARAGAVRYAALLTPQGKVISDMFVWPDSGNEDSAQDIGFMLEVAPARATELIRRLTLYKLRAQVTIEDVTGKFHVLYSPTSFRGGEPDPRFPEGELGWREVSTLPAERFSFSDGAQAYNAHRITVGAPDLARDAAPEEVFALEALLEELKGVDFQKGCFVGQENVSRMKRRATTRKKFCPVVFDGDPPPYGAPIRAGEAEIGSVRSGIPGRAIALLRLDRALDAADKGQALTTGDKTVRLDPPPWLLLPTRDD